jgi:hypothetical protein
MRPKPRKQPQRVSRQPTPDEEHIDDIKLPTLSPEGLVNVLTRRAKHMERCFRSLGDDGEGGTAEGFRAFADLAVRAVREGLRRVSVVEHERDDRGRELQAKLSELALTKVQMDDVKKSVMYQLKTHVQELNEKWVSEKARIEMLSTQLDDKLRAVEETHPESPIPELKGTVESLQKELRAAEASILDFRLKLQIANQRLESQTEEGAENMVQYEQIMSLHQVAKGRAEALEEEKHQLEEGVRMLQQECYMYRAQVEAHRHQIRMMMKNASSIFAGKVSGVPESKLAHSRVANGVNRVLMLCDDLAYSTTYQPDTDGWDDDRGKPLDVLSWTKTNLSEGLSETKRMVALTASRPEKKMMERNRAERIQKDKVQGRVRPGSSVMMVPLSDPRCSVTAYQDFYADPIEAMEAMCAGLRYAMASARQEPVTDPDESAGNMLGLPSIYAITGVEANPPRFFRTNGNGEHISPFCEEEKTLLPLDVCRATCRAILDAKSVEVMMAGDDFTQLTPMPNFCHAWVAKYRVDMNEGCIKEQVEISASDALEMIKEGGDLLQWDSAFIRFAHSVQAYRFTGFEMHTFAGFLFEELPLDVLSFFPHGALCHVRGT